MPALAWAQMSTRGDRALFGGGVGNAEQVLSIGSNAGALVLRDADRPASDDPRANRRRQVPLAFREASASLAYRLDVPYAQVEASLTGFSYYQPPPRKQWLNDYSFAANASTGRTWQISPRSQVSVNQAVSFQPAYQALLPTRFRLWYR